MFGKRAIFMRPFCAEFLEFCFDKFEVGIWTSRNKKDADKVIDLTMRNIKNKLLFCWDRSYCTETEFNTLENKNNTIAFKELSKLWDNTDTDLPWEKGYYNASNTLLLDDSPYKTLLNPPYTSVFPETFSYTDESNNYLGGELRPYLDGLAKAEDMHKYVKENSFGKPAHNETSENWQYYSQVIDSVMKAKGNSKLKA